MHTHWEGPDQSAVVGANQRRDTRYFDECYTNCIKNYLNMMLLAFVCMHVRHDKLLLIINHPKNPYSAVVMINIHL